MPTLITGSIKDLTGTAVTSGCYVRVQLKGNNGNVPRVPNTAVIATGSGAGRDWFADMLPDASGNVSGTFYSNRDAAGTGNGDIEAGGSLTATYYRISVNRGPRTSVWSQNFLARNGVTLDLNTAAPTTSNPVAVPATANTTFAALDGSNMPFTGQVVGKNGTVGSPSFAFASSLTTGFWRQAADVIGVSIAGVLKWLVNAAGVLFGSAQAIVWSSNTDPSAAAGDSFLTRIGAAILGLGSTNGGTNGELRLSKINKVTITQPANGSTLTIADGKVLTVDNTIELAGTDGTKHTFPNNTGTVAELNLAQTWTAAQTFNATALGLKPTFQSFTTAGTATFTIPAGITALKVTVIAGGGAGGGATAANNGGGGASGGVGVKWLSSLTPGGTLAVTVGAGGTGVSAAGGNSGGNSSVASGTQSITTISTNGGGGGASTGATSAGGTAPAAGSGGDSPLNVGGNPGQPNVIANVGGNGGAGPFGGAGGGGGGGAGNPATGPGSGGGGAGAAGNAAGGNGANGTVIFEWVT